MDAEPDTDQIRTTVRGQDWYGEDLTGVVHERVDFANVDLTEATGGGGARFVDCSFRTVTFNCTQLSGAAFENCAFANCSFFDVDLTDGKFVGSRFTGCRLDQLRVAGGDWSFTSLAGADLSTASFDGVRMREADLSGVRCAGGKLLRCDLSGAVWSRADLTGADLRGSDLSSLDVGEVAVRGAIIEGWQAVVLAQTLGLDVRAE